MPQSDEVSDEVGPNESCAPCHHKAFHGSPFDQCLADANRVFPVRPCMLRIDAVFLSVLAADPDRPDHFSWIAGSEENDRDSGASFNRDQIQSGQGESESPSE